MSSMKSEVGAVPDTSPRESSVRAFASASSARLARKPQRACRAVRRIALYQKLQTGSLRTSKFSPSITQRAGCAYAGGSPSPEPPSQTPLFTHPLRQWTVNPIVSAPSSNVHFPREEPTPVTINSIAIFDPGVVLVWFLWKIGGGGGGFLSRMAEENSVRF